ncbi:MAG TPA: FMN-binding negative transcriptional regulator [Stellaceae bacterium]|nr:FMN-binding negative transcriptional regulator [Stellaceae bacterium]
MYVPTDFNEDRVPVLHAAIREIAFGTLVTLGTDGLTASHVPMLVEPGSSPLGTLWGHLARANPQWQTVRHDVPALAIFAGPNAYISPSWYATKQATGKVVPTWNYVAIHAYGALRIIDDAAHARAHLERLTQTHEAGRAQPWAIDDAPEAFIAGMLKGIVSFELAIERLEGKWKMSQNRPAEDRAGVVAGLKQEGRSPGVAALVAAASERR